MPGILVLTRRPDNHASQRLKNARPDAGVQLVDPFELELRITGGQACVLKHGEELNLTDAIVIPRIGSLASEYTLSVLEHMVAAGARSLNPLRGLLTLRHKFHMISALAAAGLPVPDSVMLRSNSDFEGAVDALGGYPLVLKFVRGGQGVGVIKAPDDDTVRSVLEALNLIQYDILLQRFLPGAATHDLRVFVLGGVARWAIQRTSAEGRFRSNFHRGGSVAPVGIEPEVAELAERAAGTFGLGMAGVDIAEDDGRRCVLEVNASPGFEGTEGAHEADIAGAIVEYVAALGSAAAGGSGLPG